MALSSHESPVHAARLRLPPRPMRFIPVIDPDMLQLPNQVIDPEVLVSPNQELLMPRPSLTLSNLLPVQPPKQSSSTSPPPPTSAPRAVVPRPALLRDLHPDSALRLPQRQRWSGSSPGTWCGVEWRNLASTACFASRHKLAATAARCSRRHNRAGHRGRDSLLPAATKRGVRAWGVPGQNLRSQQVHI